MGTICKNVPQKGNKEKSCVQLVMTTGTIIHHPLCARICTHDLM